MDSRIRQLERRYKAGDLSAEEPYLRATLSVDPGDPTLLHIGSEKKPNPSGGKVKVSPCGLLSVHRTVGFFGGWDRRAGYTVSHVPTGCAILTGIKTETLALDLRDLMAQQDVWCFTDAKKFSRSDDFERTKGILNQWKFDNGMWAY